MLGSDGGVDVNVAIGEESQHGVGIPADRVAHKDVAVATGRALVGGIDLDGVVGQLAAELGAGDVPAAGGDGEVIGVDQPAAGLALGGLGRDRQTVLKFDLGRAGFDEAAVAAQWRAGVEPAADRDRVMRQVAQQQDLALLAAGQGLRLDHAAVVDDRGAQVASGLGG